MASDPLPNDPAPAAPVPSQRVRVGMLGLASVFLLVMLATAILSLGGEDGPGSNLSAPANTSEAPREPLAELGVAPGNPPASPPPPRTAPR